jgi:hypothetical protein
MGRAWYGCRQARAWHPWAHDLKSPDQIDFMRIALGAPRMDWYWFCSCRLLILQTTRISITERDSGREDSEMVEGAGRENHGVFVYVIRSHVTSPALSSSICVASDAVSVSCPLTCATMAPCYGRREQRASISHVTSSSAHSHRLPPAPGFDAHALLGRFSSFKVV